MRLCVTRASLWRRPQQMASTGAQKRQHAASRQAGTQTASEAHAFCTDAVVVNGLASQAEQSTCLAFLGAFAASSFPLGGAGCCCKRGSRHLRLWLWLWLAAGAAFRRWRNVVLLKLRCCGRRARPALEHKLAGHKGMGSSRRTPRAGSSQAASCRPSMPLQPVTPKQRPCCRSNPSECGAPCRRTSLAGKRPSQSSAGCAGVPPR